MADRTKIEWCTTTWNPITGCSPISEACEHCYARRMAHRLRGRFGYPQDDPFKVTFHPDRLEQPLKWKKPRMIFVVSMGDLFHPGILWSDNQKIWEIMACCPKHTFLLLTKRPERMEIYLTEDLNYKLPLPLSNVWLGVTAENQQRFNERWEDFIQIPASKKFISFEPLLSPIALDPCEWRMIDWVIVGGESGPGARPMHPDWVRSVRDQCQNAGVPFFFKSWGEWAPLEGTGAKAPIPIGFWTDDKGIIVDEPDRILCRADDQVFMSGIYTGSKVHMVKIGKKHAGRLLDGREWDEVPE